MKKFAYWDKEGATHVIEADSVAFKRKGAGLKLTFKTGETKTVLEDCICMTEMAEEKKK